MSSYSDVRIMNGSVFFFYVSILCKKKSFQKAHIFQESIKRYFVYQTNQGNIFKDIRNGLSQIQEVNDEFVERYFYILL